MDHIDGDDTRGRVSTQRYSEVRGLTERLAEPLGPEDQTVQSMPDVSPTKWHRGHVTWFFETFILARHAQGYRCYDPAFGFLFNSYYEAEGPRYQRARRGMITRPGIAAIATYRQHVDKAMLGLIGDDPSPEIAALIELGLHHEQQHQELLLMDICHVLWQNPTAPAMQPAADRSDVGGAAPLRWCGCEGGLVGIGHRGGGFSYDNESPRHEVFLEPFAIADRLVSAGEWKAFIDDGGYRRADLWLSDGWAIVQSEGWEAPLYWTRDGSGWQHFTLSGLQPVDDGEAVVHVSHYEADAFARWSGARLPSEFEWEHAVEVLDGGLRRAFDDVWQWTSSAYLPYPRFRPAPGAVGEYNGKFMSNQMVLRGSSFATPTDHARPTYRNFFPPAARWAFAGLRMAADV